MKVLNKLIKGLGYIFIHLVTLLESYLISLIFSASAICAFFSVWSAVTKTLPEIVTEKFWLVYLILSIPFAVIVFIKIQLDIHKMKKTKNKE